VPKTVFIFVDTSLELIPKEIFYTDLIKNHSRKRGKKASQIILDSSYHHHVMKKLNNFKKRGRPDIIHYCLLNILGSTLVKDNPDSIWVFIHTINNELIEINPETRLPRNFNRFIGLMEQLFENRIIKAKDEILLQFHENKSFEDILVNILPENRFLLTSKGKSIDLPILFAEHKNDDIAIFIGGFPYGSISNEIMKLAPNLISIYPNALDAWIVLNKTIYAREYTINK